MAVVALLTDFGLHDHYVGVMKGVVLSVCPEAALVDITHDVPPQDVLAAALELAAAYRYFPPGTVFLVVVDPGVGSARRAIAASAGGYTFVGPDNGVFTQAFRETPPDTIVELRERKYARSTISRTFEGRDRFAPAAGWAARGVALTAFGPVAADYQRLAIPEATGDAEGIRGEVLRVDRFGNLITNISREMFVTAGWPGDAAVEVAIETHPPLPLVSTYSETAVGAACALFGSSGHLEIAVNGGSAARQFRAVRGAAVRVKPCGTIPGCHDHS